MEKLSILSYSCKIAFSIFCFLFFSMDNLRAQNSMLGQDINLKVRTTGKLISLNKLILVVDVEIPEGWSLMVVNGYESMLEGQLDTVDMTLKFRKNSNYKIVERLKADRKPSIRGYYKDDVRFVQTLRINSEKVPLYIDSTMELYLLRNDNKDNCRVKSCCLLQVCQKRSAIKTLNVGWDCERREKVYLEDVTNSTK